AIVNSFRRSVADKVDLVDSFMRFVGPNRAVIDDLVDARPTGEPQCRRFGLGGKRLIGLRLRGEIRRWRWSGWAALTCLSGAGSSPSRLRCKDPQRHILKAGRRVDVVTHVARD